MYSPFPHFPQYTLLACFLLSNTHKQFCVHIVFFFSWDFQSSQEKCNNAYAKLFVCVGGQETCKQERERVNVGFGYFQNFFLYITLAMHFTVLRNILNIAHHNLS